MKPLSEATAKLLKPATLESTDWLRLELTDDGKSFNARCYAKVDYSWRTPSSRATRFMQRFPERQHLRTDGDGEHWKLGATDHTVEIIESGWPKTQLSMDEDAREVWRYLLINRMRQGLVAERTAEFKSRKVIPQVEGGFELHPEYPLSGYQQIAAINSMGAEGYALFMDQGTGKTATVIARIMNECHRKERTRPIDIYKVLIVCPRQVRLNWQNEIIKFATRRGRVTRILGGELARMRRCLDALKIDEDDEFTCVIASYESVQNTWQGLKALGEWDLVVVDESHYIKNRATKRFKQMEELRERSKQRMVLTGTPITNTPFDLYTQWEFLGQGWSGFTTFDAFKKFFGVFDKGKGRDGLERLVAFQNMPFFQERLAKQAYVIRKEEAMPDMPSKVYDIVGCDMSKEQQDAYEQMLTTLQVQIENELTQSDETATSVNNILTQMLRLSQITSGHLIHEEVYDNDGQLVRPKSIHRFDPNPKLEQLVEMLKEKGPNEKTLIWSCYVQDIKTIRARLEMEGIDCVTYYGGTSDADRDKAVERFNADPNCKVFIGNPAAGGAGLNLLGYVPERADEYETNCTHIIYYAQNWSMVHRAQSEDRAHRRGTRVQVRISTLVCEETIDEVIHQRVGGKIAMANNIKDLKEILAGVFKDFMALS